MRIRDFVGISAVLFAALANAQTVYGSDNHTEVKYFADGSSLEKYYFPDGSQVEKRRSVDGSFVERTKYSDGRVSEKFFGADGYPVRRRLRYQEDFHPQCVYIDSVRYCRKP